MRVLTLDFETYYSREYSLRKMSPVEYILDPRFQCTGLAVKRGDAPAEWVHGEDVEDFFRELPTEVMCISHNALFDMSICAWRYGWVPKLMVDTLGIARATLAKELKYLSLDKVGEHLGIGRKTGALATVLGMRREDIQARPDIYQNFIEYGKNDADICYGIYEKLVLSGEFPMKELLVMDMVLRCTVQPQFIADVDLLRQSLAEIQKGKEETLVKAMMLGAENNTTIRSNEQFAELLRQYGVEPPTKVSQITGKTSYAFAKTDQAFNDLLEHPNPAVQALVAARLDLKSTIEETRHERFINIASLEWPEVSGPTPVTSQGYRRLMPMPLRYSGAHTHRLSGDWKLNCQNMGRGSVLRRSLCAPEGYVVVAGDESQVEARITCTLAGQEDMRQQFENGEDVYSIFATDLFGREISKKDKIERFIGKTAILGLGYGLGKDKFTESIPVLAWNQMGIQLPFSPEEGERTVGLYRTKNFHIANTWRLLGTNGIRALTGGGDWQWGPVLFRKEEIVLPNGLKLYYHNLRQEERGGEFGGYEWVFDYGGMTKRIYGGKLLENIVQALARIIVMDAAIEVQRHLHKLGIRLALQVHDELVFVVKKEHEEVTRFVLEHELKRRPKWLPNLPLDCEIASGPTYGSAK